MELLNPFPLEVKTLWLYDNFTCWECGQNGTATGGMDLHHIYGRVSASALNCAPLCRLCHSKVGHTKEEHQKYLTKTLKFLLAQGYTLKPVDNLFLETVQKDLLPNMV